VGDEVQHVGLILAQSLGCIPQILSTCPEIDGMTSRVLDDNETLGSIFAILGRRPR